MGLHGSNVFFNPFSTTATLRITGAVDDELLINGISSYSGHPGNSGCGAHLYDITITVGPGEATYLTYYNNHCCCVNVDAVLTYSV